MSIRGVVPPNLAAALSYASRGWPVIPIHGYIPEVGCTCEGTIAGCKPGKHPHIRDWVERASLDSKTITRWYSEWPDANVGVRTGDGMFALDIDPDHGGDETLAALEREHDRLPDTVESLSGGGGRHLWFLSDGLPVPNSVSKIGSALGDGLDVRGDGGLVVVPYSIHQSGRRYEWESCHGPDDVPLARAPAWLLDAARRPPQRLRGRAPLVSLPGGHQGAAPRGKGPAVGEGSRNSTLFAIATAMQGRGEPEHAIRREVLRVNATKCQPPLPDREVETLLRSALTYDANRVPVAASGGSAPALEPPALATVVSLRGPRITGGGPPDPPAPPPPGGHDWERHLTRSGQGIKGSLNNAATILGNDPAWAGAVRFNEFASKLELTRSLPFERDYASGESKHALSERLIAEPDVLRTAVWMERNWRIEVPPGKIYQALELCGRRSAYHPVRDYLSGLRWDREQSARTGVRVYNWLTTLFGCEDTEATRQSGTWWLLQAVARIFKPGCKADGVLILEGPQWAGKSEALKRLCGAEWFSDELPNLEDKDAKMMISGFWMIEIPEFDAFHRTGLSTVKKFVRQFQDVYRPPYQRSVVQVPRQCVFVATTNEREYLRDATGGTRFMPVRMAEGFRPDFEAIEAARDNLLAEAVDMFHANMLWYPTTQHERDIMITEQDARYIADPWETRMGAYLSDTPEGEPVLIPHLLEYAVRLRNEAQDRAHATRAGVILGRLGWIKGDRTRLDKDVLTHPWWPPGTTEEFLHGAEGRDVAVKVWKRFRSREAQANKP